MSSEFYVQETVDNFPGRLFGPGDWNSAVAKVKQIIQVWGCTCDNEEAKALEMDGFYVDPVGGASISIICAESMDTPLFRMLNANEVVQEGDQRLEDDEWVEVPSIQIGEVAGLDSMMSIRRAT